MRALLLAVALAAVVATPRAQTAAPPPQAAPPQDQQPTFRSTVDAVTVDAIVTDKQGKPVLDLKPEDFVVQEDHKLQQIQTFKLINIDDNIDPDPAKYPEIHSLADQEREAARDDVRLVVIFLDDYHVRRGDDLSMRAQLSKWVDALDPRDLVAIMYPLTEVDALTFTRDHEDLARAVAGFLGRKYDYTPHNPYEDIYSRMMPQDIEALRNQIVILKLKALCTYLGTLRTSRTALLFVSEGMSSTLPAAINNIGQLPPTTAAPQLSPFAQARAESFAASQLMNDLEFVFRAANQSNTAVYALDPRGLAVSEFDVSMPNVGIETDHRVLQESGDTLRALADETGGRAIVNSNTFAPGLKQMLTDSSSYYLLGYTSTQAPRDGRFHQIEITLKRKGLEVRARKGYWAYTAEDFARASAPPSAVAAARRRGGALGDCASRRTRSQRTHMVRSGPCAGRHGRRDVRVGSAAGRRRPWPEHRSRSTDRGHGGRRCAVPRAGHQGRQRHRRDGTDHVQGEARHRATADRRAVG